MVRLRLLVLINSQLLLKYTKKIHSLSRKVGTFIHSFNLEVNEYSFRLCTSRGAYYSIVPGLDRTLTHLKAVVLIGPLTVYRTYSFTQPGALVLYWIVTARGKIKVLDTGIQNIHNIIEHVYNHRTFDIGYPPPTPSRNGFTLGTLEGFGGTYRYQDL